MKKIILSICFLLVFVIGSFAQFTDRQLIINTTGNGFDHTTSNGVDSEKWDYIQKFANLTYNGQDASVTAVRLHVTWNHYEPTLGNYQRAKLVQAIQAITGLKSGNMKIALHFPYQRPGLWNDSYFGQSDLAKTAAGNYVAENVAFTNPSIYSAYGKQRFYAFVADVLDQVIANGLLSKVLYVEMGNGSAEEFAMPYLNSGGQLSQGFYEDKALEAWRTQYLPCRYPGQTNVTWNSNTYTIASAPPATNPYGDWNNEHQREYHRFASWGLMNFYKGFRDVVKGKNSSIKVVYFISDFGGGQGNQWFLHNATLPMALQEFDGIYTSDGTNIYDLWKKIMPVDVIKGTNANKIASIEFDQEDLGQTNPSTSTSPITPSLATEWISRAYKHGVNNVHLAMFFNDTQIEQLKPILADIRATYLQSGYTAPSRQSPVTQNIFPEVFTGTQLFSSWNNNGGGNWSSTDNNPVSVNMIDNGYWENIWSCTPTNTCDFNISGSGPSGSVGTNASVTLNSTCSGQCSGVSYSWSGNGISGSNASVTFNAPSTAGTYTYTVTASKSGCSSKTSDVQVVVAANCDFTISASNSNSNPSAGAGLNLTYSCSGADCGGVSYAWSGNGISGSSSPLSITAPSTAGNYTYTVTASKSGCSNKTANTAITVGSGSNPCNLVDKANIGTWNGLNVQARQYTVNGNAVWLIVTAVSGSSTDKHFPRGSNFAARNDISWSNGAVSETCFGGGGTGWDGLVKPSGITTPSGYTAGSEPDGAQYFEQTCSAPSAPSLSASPSSITSGSSSTLSASGCSGGTITWSNSLGTGTSKSVSPTATTTYTATCSIGGCTSSNGSVTVTVTSSGGPNCGSLNSNMDGANCGFIEGWIYDQSSPNTVVNVDIYEGSTLLLSNVPANKFRQDLLNAGFGNGVHGLEVATPSQLKDGQTHVLTIKASGCSSYQLNGSPRTISGCSNLMLDPGTFEVLPVNKQLVIAPNPSKGVFQTTFFLEKGKKATIVVTDLVGRQIYRQVLTGQGQHRENIYLTNKASGTLLFQLVKENGVEVKKINIVR